MPDSSRLIFHLLPNAHLDPVWLWDWREGLNEGLITVRTVLDLMDEFPELTFMRGESAIYEHIQKTDPGLFQRIRERIEEGRWDVVGGTVIQPDTNLASTEVLCREFERGLDYFEKNLRVRPKVAWLADSFGHSAGFPNILAAFGMEGFAFTRPQRDQFTLDSPAFWWEGGEGNRILCYRQHWKWYCSERHNMGEILDATLRGAREGAEGQKPRHVGVLCGLGNHGGGPTRRHLWEVERWKRGHPEVELRFGTLHGFFEKLKNEARRVPGSIPTVRGEFGYCLRGCYSSVQRFKALYRQGEARVAAAEITRSAIGAATGTRQGSLDQAWDALVFNAFHDILPGSSIERAIDEQTAWMGSALHQAQSVQFAALNQLAARVDTSVPEARRPDLPKDVPLLVWNSLPRPFKGQVELEASLDYRPIWPFNGRASELPVVAYDHAGKPAAFQVIGTEHTSMPDLPWRRRVVMPLEIPALGWTMVRLGWRDAREAAGPFPSGCQAQSGPNPRIAGGLWTLEAKAGGVSIQRDGVDFFSPQRNLEMRVIEDPWGSWGGMNEERDSYCLEELREVLELEQSEILESGPLRAKLWTRWKGKNSWIDLTFGIAAETPWLKIEGRMLWNERSARVKLVIPCRGQLEYAVPGGRIARDAEGQVPGGRWVVRSGGGKTVGMASDVLSDFDATADELRVTLARASRYANDVKTAPSEMRWQPATDCGELKFQLCLFGEDVQADHVADALLFPPTVITTPATSGPWKTEGSLACLAPDSLRLHSLEQTAPDGLRLRIQNNGHNPADAIFQWGGQRLRLGKLAPGEIRTILLKRDQAKEGRWTECRTLDDNQGSNETRSQSQVKKSLVPFA